MVNCQEFIKEIFEKMLFSAYFYSLMIFPSSLS